MSTALSSKTELPSKTELVASVVSTHVEVTASSTNSSHYDWSKGGSWVTLL